MTGEREERERIRRIDANRALILREGAIGTPRVVLVEAFDDESQGSVAGRVVGPSAGRRQRPGAGSEARGRGAPDSRGEGEQAA